MVMDESVLPLSTAFRPAIGDKGGERAGLSGAGSDQPDYITGGAGVECYKMALSDTLPLPKLPYRGHHIKRGKTYAKAVKLVYGGGF
jgi:hypothetical protein